MAKKDLENLKINREETALSFGMHVGYFQNLMGFMGFSEGLCAMYEEPDEVKALMEYLCDFFVRFGEKCIDYYKPDIVNITDDTATWKNPFFSPEMYQELFKPYHARQAKLGTDRGLPIEMHNCGRCEDFIDDWRDFGSSPGSRADVERSAGDQKEIRQLSCDQTALGTSSQHWPTPTCPRRRSRNPSIGRSIHTRGRRGMRSAAAS